MQLPFRQFRHDKKHCGDERKQSKDDDENDQIVKNKEENREDENRHVIRFKQLFDVRRD